MPDTMMQPESLSRPPIADLAAALCKAQAEMEGAKKDATNPHFKTNYADLASVWAAIREPLTKNGLAVVQLLRSIQGGVEVETILLHSSGQQISDVFAVPATKNDAQGYGSAATYARRYALMAMVGVAPEDDDGNGAVGPAGSAGGGGDFRPPGPRRPMPAQSSAHGRELARQQPDLVDHDRQKGTLPGKAPATNGKKSADQKAKEWVDRAIGTLKLPGQHVESLDRWWTENDKIPDGAKFSAIGWLEEAVPAEYERLLATFNEIRDAAKQVAA
jgi:hypothetical protein